MKSLEWLFQANRTAFSKRVPLFVLTLGPGAAKLPRSPFIQYKLSGGSTETVSHMAIRSSAGTGVIVSLIVFVILTILLLAGSILLWGQLETAKQDADDAATTLDDYAKTAERNTAEWLSPLMDASGRESVTKYLYNQNQSLRQFAIGSPDGSLSDLDKTRAQLSLQPGQSLADGLKDAQRRLGELTSQVAALQSGMAAAEQSARASDDRLNAAVQERDDLLVAEATALEPYTEADERYPSEIQTATSNFQSMQTNTRDDMNHQINELQDEVDNLTAQNKRIKGKNRMLKNSLNRDQLRAADPATLADGRILDVIGGGDHVYINRGRNDQIVLGMTFEVYNSASQIRPDENGEEPRGKASIQVVKIGGASSTAKVTRRVKGRPILAGNIIANAVYDPDYQFKFLVHGVFDLDRNGKSTEQEAEYLRERIERWGGVVVRGNDIPGDLDFLVLGETPNTPIQPFNSGSTQAMDEYRRLRTAADRYQSLLLDAQQAEIPVLNQNRLDILTGRTDL
jgi:hypothetical protein